MTILKFARDESAANVMFGLVLLPASLAFLVYALFQCKSIIRNERCGVLFFYLDCNLKHFSIHFSDMRRSYMIREHIPGPYIDVAGPTLLTVLLIFSIIAQFCARLYHDMNV
jgi:hypothetical protein